MTEKQYPETLELAMLAVQSELTNPIKDATNPHFKSKYATLPEIRNLVTPILAKYGLYCTQTVDIHDNGHVALDTHIVHAPTARSTSSIMPLMLERQTPQGQGSAITYARRYALCAMLNIAADEDDDGHAAEKKPAAKSQKLDPQSPNLGKPAREAQSMPDHIFESYRMDIGVAEDMDELKTVYTKAYNEALALGDRPAMEGFTKVKNIRKQELQMENA